MFQPLVEEQQVDNKKTKVEGLEGAAQVPNTFGEFTADKVGDDDVNVMIWERLYHDSDGVDIKKFIVQNKAKIRLFCNKNLKFIKSIGTYLP